MDLKEASEIQPGLSPHLVGATYSPQDAHVNPMKLCQAFAKAAKELGTEVYLNTGVLDIRLEKGKVKSVITSKGEVQTKTVINAAGVYAPMIGEMVGLSLPIKPRRGQIIVTEPVPKLVMADVLCAKYIVAKYNPKTYRGIRQPETRLGVGLSRVRPMTVKFNRCHPGICRLQQEYNTRSSSYNPEMPPAWCQLLSPFMP